MKKIVMLFTLLLIVTAGFTQADKEQYALAVSNADDANTKKLMQYIWKRKSDVSIDGQLKLSTLTEFSFDEQGKLQAQTIDAQSTVKDKKGIRGKMQENAVEDKGEYVQKALELSLAYTYMTKGQLLDFFSKATIAEKGALIEATGTDVYVKGDKLTILIDKQTNLYTKKTFSSLLGKDPVSGEINYEKFSNGINHGSTTVLNMPAQKMKIDAKNQDYSQRVK
jgi:hypothetical protein